MRIFGLAAVAALALTTNNAFAMGSDDDTPPTPTETTTVCEDNQVYDEESKECVGAETQSLNDDQRYRAVRELSYSGAFSRALAIIDTASQNDPRFLNYRGFIARKAGRWTEAQAYYEAALTIDPDYLLARSYMGMGLASVGDLDGAKEQLAEIGARGGKGTWPYIALKRAITEGPSGY